MKKMKRIFNTLMFMAMALLSFSCQEELDIEMPVNESIILDLSSGGLTKSIVEDNDRESFINHIDVMIFETGADNKPADRIHHEKISVNDPAKVVLAVKRTEFEPNKEYFVYIVANSSLDLSGITHFSGLNDKKQEDPLLHLTGLHLGAGINNPQYFLMDAVAVDAEGNSPAVLYDGNPANDTVLGAELKRAAAKVVINITAGDKVDFKNYGVAEGSEGGLYYVRNLPYDTYLLAETKAAANIDNANLRTTGKADSEYFTWHPETDPKNVSLITYVYPHQWITGSILEKETCVVMNLPMEFTDGNGNKIPYHNSWYKIPMTDNKTFDRNNCYMIDITLNRPGATSESEPVKIENLYYSVEDWTSINVNVGGSNGPDYLQLNTNHVDMYNVNTDNGSLTFASSSEINHIELLEAYYYNYLDEKIDLSIDKNDKYNVFENINAVAESGVITGAITINSPFVAKSEKEIEKEIMALGPAPTVPDAPGDPPVDPRIEEVNKPVPEDYLKNNTNNTEYRYKDGKFETRTRRNKQWGSWQADRQTQARYDADLAEYNRWAEWNAKSDAEKQTAISEYESALAAYNAAVKAYEDAIAALEIYENKVQQIRESSGNSHSNAIREMRFKVTNVTGQTAEFTVSQYPTIYITNKRGSYSYRSDFGGTNYKDGIGEENRSGVNWYEDEWSYDWTASNNYFFGSKVALTSGSGYTINYVYYNENNNDRQTTSRIDGLNNPRMYHVHVTATSSMYTVAVPRLDADGYTESSADNTKLVSPSFMIASQLGATQTPKGGIEQARSHCEQYIEVGADGTVYDDWRLPTAAEIDIIIQHQDISDAMAVVLTGTAYYCAYNTDNNGNVIYTKATGKNGGQNAVRCIRDAY